MKVAILYFEGPNDIAITSMVFPSIEEGLAKVKELSGKEMVTEDGKTYSLYLYDEMNAEKMCDDCTIMKEVPGKLCVNCPHFSRKFFTGYYGGCGEAHTAVLKEVEFGVPLFGWDLD